MASNRFLGILLFWIWGYLLTAQVTIQITGIPEDTPSNDTLFIASNLNNWNPADTNYMVLSKKADTLSVTFSPPIRTIAYKFTRGSWTSVEVDTDGQDIANRVIEYDGSPINSEVIIEGWKTNVEQPSTAANNVTVLHEKFYIPQLDKKRKVWIYLPPDYENSQKRYPVLYMHDGQNLFDDKTSFSGEWEVDESLNNLFAQDSTGVVVIGIENGGADRVGEYTPWPNPQFGGGQGDAYVDFLVETLKPYVDAHYRTKPDREHTGIMGSSLGGLISFYAALEHQDVFSKAGVFSPSFWFSQEIFKQAETIEKQYDIQFYFLGGELEGEPLIKDMETMVSLLQKAGFEDAKIEMVTKADGQHNEAFWAREFEACFSWLFR